MEILSTGEKIKRARIYKRITLKELCGEEISISKMSCIENGKIKADDGEKGMGKDVHSGFFQTSFNPVAPYGNHGVGNRRIVVLFR